MAKDKDKEEAKPAAKAPLFSKLGLIVLLLGCAGSAGVPLLMMGKKGPEAPPHANGNGDEPHPEMHPEGPKTMKTPRIQNTFALEPIQVNYQDSGMGAPRRSLTVTVVLEILTEYSPDPAHEDPKDKRKEADENRMKDVEKLRAWITDRIISLMRGKTPEHFATNEMVDQVKQQIRHAINEERFGGEAVIQNVLFTQLRL